MKSKKQRKYDKSTEELITDGSLSLTLNKFKENISSLSDLSNVLIKRTGFMREYNKVQIQDFQLRVSTIMANTCFDQEQLVAERVTDAITDAHSSLVEQHHQKRDGFRYNLFYNIKKWFGVRPYPELLEMTSSPALIQEYRKSVLDDSPLYDQERFERLLSNKINKAFAGAKNYAGDSLEPTSFLISYGNSVELDLKFSNSDSSKGREVSQDDISKMHTLRTATYVKSDDGIHGTENVTMWIDMVTQSNMFSELEACRDKMLSLLENAKAGLDVKQRPLNDRPRNIAVPKGTSVSIRKFNQSILDCIHEYNTVMKRVGL